MASIVGLPQEILNSIIDYLLEYTLHEADITRTTCRDLQNLRLSHRNFTAEYSINYWLFRRILLRLSTNSCQRLANTYQSIGPYVESLIIEPSQFMVIRSFHEYRTLLTIHRKSQSDGDPVSEAWDDLELAEAEIFAGYTAYNNRQKEDELAVEVLRDNAQCIFASFTNLQSIKIFKSWDDGGADAQKVLTLMPLVFKGFVERDSFRSSNPPLARREKKRARRGKGFERVPDFDAEDVLDQMVVRYSCLNIIHTTWSVLPYLLRSIGGRHMTVYLGDNHTFEVDKSLSEFRCFSKGEFRTVPEYIEALYAGMPTHRIEGRTWAVWKLKAAVDRNLDRSAMAFLADLSTHISVDTVYLAAGANIPPRWLAGARDLYTFAHTLQKLTVEHRIIRTDHLFESIRQCTALPKLQELTFLDCVYQHGYWLPHEACQQFLMEAENLENESGKIKVVLYRNQSEELLATRNILYGDEWCVVPYVDNGFSDQVKDDASYDKNDGRYGKFMIRHSSDMDPE